MYSTALQLAAEAVKDITPPDYEAMAARLERLDERLKHVEDTDAMLRAYIVEDERWHFDDDLQSAREGRALSPRMTFQEFAQRWADGWRPTQ